MFTVFTVFGNAGSLIARTLQGKSKSCGSFGVFVGCLCLSDLLMGLYLAMLGSVDIVYLGEYVFHDQAWKTSSICSLAGVLCLLSSEVSAFTISLITLDRFLVLRFPFSSVHFSRLSAVLTCCLSWCLGVVLATYPLLPHNSHWRFFSQTGMCIPLPFVPRDSFPGYMYSFTVMIVVNFVMFMLIALGQVSIYASIQANSLTSTNSDTSKAKEGTIARRLITIAVSDFLCWFPVGLLGVLSFNGVPIPEELNVAVVIFILPVNAAINPFLYTVNMILEKRQYQKERNILQHLQKRNIEH